MRPLAIGFGLWCICAGSVAAAQAAGQRSAPIDPLGDQTNARQEPRADGLSFTLDAPELAFDGEVCYATRGFVLHIPRQQLPREHALAGFLADNDCLITGDALRWDRAKGAFYAHGNINLVSGGLHLQADRLGFDATRQRADCWQLRIVLRRPDGLLAEIEADHLAFAERTLELRRIRARSGHGSLLRSGAAAMRIRLHQPGEVNEHRSGLLRHIRDISLERPVGRLAEVPALWLPMAYRDYTLDYPWTRYRLGVSRHRGYQFGVAIADDLPTWAGLQLRPGARIDWRDRQGEGYGLDLAWRHRDLGRGHARWFGVEDEHRYTDGGDTLIQRRSRETVDFGHEGSWQGALGRLDATFHYDELADPDLDAAGISDLRFRQDWQEERLTTEPLPRQGGALVWSGPFGSLAYTRERPAHESVPWLIRHHQIDWHLSPVPLAGPAHALLDVQMADLERGALHARRLQGVAAIGSRWWLGGLGLGATAGGRFLGYDEDAAVGGLEESVFDWYPFLELEVGPVLRADFEGGLSHVIEPAIAFVAHGDRRGGDDLPELDFGDDGDRFAADQRRLRLDLDTSISQGGRSFSLGLQSEWTVRAEDRFYRDDDGIERQARGNFAGLRINAAGSPAPGLSLDANVVYDGFRDRPERFDSTASFATTALLLELQTVWRFDRDDPDGLWTYRPRLTWQTGRYSFEGELDIRHPDGRTIDRYRLEIRRHLVDGHLGLSYERRYDEDGHFDDDALMLTWGLYGIGPAIAP